MVGTGGNRQAGQDGNQQHAATAAGVEMEGVAGGGFGGLGVVDCGRWRVYWQNGEQLTAADEVGSAISIGGVAVMTAAVETVGQNMEEEAADEFRGGRSHQLVLAGVEIVFPAKADAGASGARFVVAQDARRSDPGLAANRNGANVGFNGILLPSGTGASSE